MQRRLAPAVGAVAVLSALASCSSIAKMQATLKELKSVQEVVARTTGSQDVRVNLNNGQVLMVAVANSSLNELPPAGKQAKALEIARLAYRTYASRSALVRVDVAFGVRRSYFGFFNYSNFDTLNFETSQLINATPSGNAPMVRSSTLLTRST